MQWCVSVKQGMQEEKRRNYWAQEIVRGWRHLGHKTAIRMKKRLHGKLLERKQERRSGKNGALKWLRSQAICLARQLLQWKAQTLMRTNTGSWSLGRAAKNMTVMAFLDHSGLLFKNTSISKNVTIKVKITQRAVHIWCSLSHTTTTIYFIMLSL